MLKHPKQGLKNSGPYYYYHRHYFFSSVRQVDSGENFLVSMHGSSCLSQSTTPYLDSSSPSAEPSLLCPSQLVYSVQLNAFDSVGSTSKHISPLLLPGSLHLSFQWLTLLSIGVRGGTEL